MYKGGKNHIKPADFLNFYMSERGSGGGGIKGNIKVGREEASARKSKYFVLMVCVFGKKKRTGIKGERTGERTGERERRRI